MNKLFEQFENHALFQTLANKLSFIEKSVNDDSYNEMEKESLLAYQQLLTIIKTNLSSKALPMVNKSVLDNLNTSISNLTNGVLTNINGYSTQYQSVMDWYKRIPTLEKKSEIKESYNSLIDNFLEKQERIEEKIKFEIDKFALKQEHLTELTVKEIDDFKSKQNEQFDNWENEKTKMQEEIDSLREQNDNLKIQIKNFEAEIQNQQRKIDRIIDNFETTFKENSDDFEERFTNKENEYNNTINGLLTEQKSAADKTLSHLEKRKDEVEKLWGIIGKSATVGNASSKATEHKEFADTMMWWTIALMCIALTIIGVSTWKLFSGTYTYMSFVWKVITSAIILIPAFYCANISKRQRDREFQLRDFEIKIATLEPFMENMILENNCDNDTLINKDKVKLELTKIFFDKQFTSINSSNDCILIPKELAKILNTLAKKCNLNINIGDEK